MKVKLLTVDVTVIQEAEYETRRYLTNGSRSVISEPWIVSTLSMALSCTCKIATRCHCCLIVLIRNECAHMIWKCILHLCIPLPVNTVLYSAWQDIWVPQYLHYFEYPQLTCIIQPWTSPHLSCHCEFFLVPPRHGCLMPICFMLMLYVSACCVVFSCPHPWCLVLHVVMAWDTLQKSWGTAFMKSSPMPQRMSCWR